MLLVKTLFWAACLLTIFPYTIYPLILRLANKSKQASEAITHQSKAASSRPSLTIVVSARNEEGVIVEKIENALQLDYPQDRLKILVVSDSSTDSTDKLVEEIVRVVEFLQSRRRKNRPQPLPQIHHV